MPTEHSRVTSKFQATIPREARRALRIRPGSAVRWHVLRGRVVVDTLEPMKAPTDFLAHQVKKPFDAIRMIRSVRDELV